MSRLVSCDKSGLVQSANKAFSDLLGYAEKELINTNLKNLVTLLYRTELVALLERSGDIWKELGDFVVEMHHKDGRSVPISLQGVRLQGDGDVYIFHASAVPSESCTLVFYGDGKMASQSAQLFGYENVSGVNIRTLFPSFTDPIHQFPQFLELNNGNLKGRARDGTTIVVSAHLQRINDLLFRILLTRIDSHQEVFFLVGTDARIVGCSSWMSEIFGISTENVLHKEVSALLPGFTIVNDQSPVKRRKTEEPSLLNYSRGHVMGSPILGTDTPIEWRSFPVNRDGAFALRVKRSTRLSLPSVAIPEIHRHEFTIGAPPEEPKKIVSSTHFSLSFPSLSYEESEFTFIKVDEYRLGKEIGKGASGTVRMAYHISDPLHTKPLIAKVISKKNLDPETRAKREIEILQSLSHPNVVSIHAHVETETTFFLFMEYIEGPTLEEYCAHPLGEERTRNLFRTIVEAVEYCHSQGVAHRDLKLTNMMIVTATHTIKLIDFGLSTFTEEGVARGTFCGSPAYCAPELLLGQNYPPPEVDMWSLGICLYRMITGRLPFQNITELLRMEFPPANVSQDCLDLLQKLLVVKENRISMANLVQHPWLQRRSFSIESPRISRETHQM